MPLLDVSWSTRRAALGQDVELVARGAPDGVLVRFEVVELAPLPRSAGFTRRLVGRAEAITRAGEARAPWTLGLAAGADRRPGVPSFDLVASVEGGPPGRAAPLSIGAPVAVEWLAPIGSEATPPANPGVSQAHFGAGERPRLRVRAEGLDGLQVRFDVRRATAGAASSPGAIASVGPVALSGGEAVAELDADTLGPGQYQFDATVIDPGSGASFGLPASGAACAVPVTVIELAPRSRAGVQVLNGQLTLKPGWLDGFAPADNPAGTRPPGALRAIETTFHVDLAGKIGTGFAARRRITALVATDRKPVAGARVRFTRQAGSAALRFVEGSTLVETVTLTTDANGLVEVTVQHPASAVADGDRTLVIRAALADTPATLRDLSLTITRNEHVARLRDVLGDPQKDGTARALLVFQPDPAQRRPAPAVTELADVLNAVVSRHGAIANYTFVPRDGLFGDPSRSALKAYLERFPSIKRGDWPYDLSSIGLAPSLSPWVATEYAPYDLAAHPGTVVDRRLLIGKVQDTRPANIDGLLELKLGVSDVLIRAMRTVADTFLNCQTFWLHRPIHRPYLAVATAGAVKTRGVAAVLDKPGGAPLLDGQKKPITVPAKTRLRVLSQDPARSPTFYEVRLDAGGARGWIAAGQVEAIPDDRREPINHGGPGVAYSYGCKEAPEEFTAQIEANDPKPADILSWSEYTTSHKPGLQKAEQTRGVNAYEWTGVDCSAFVQHCISRSVFPGTTIRIVPASIVTTLGKRGAVGTQVNAAGSIQAYGRRVPYEPGSARQWMRAGDFIRTKGHIVWVAGEPDDLINYQADARDFGVLNAYGGTRADIYVHKTVLMRFGEWRVSLAGGAAIGRVRVWR